MTQPSKGAAAFLTLFGLPFALAGLAFIYAQIVSRRNFEPGQVVAAVLFGSVFVFIGGVLMYAGIGGYGRMKKQAAIEEANPLSPWLWREDWAQRRAQSQHKKSEVFWWVVATLVNMVTLPFLVNLVPDYLRTHDPRVFVLLGMDLLGAILVVKAARVSLQHRRFGNGYFEFDALPFVPGQRLSGNIQLKFETQAEHGILVRLSCVRKVISGTGKEQVTSQIMLWQDEKTVPSGAILPGPLGRAIPVDFSPPADAVATTHDNPNDQILWLLHAEADVPGINYSDDFEVPVFRTSSSKEPASEFSSSFPAASGRFGFSNTQTVEPDSGAVPQPALMQVQISAGSNGTEFYFRACRNPLRALLLFAATLVWTGMTWLLYHKPAPVVFPIVFSVGEVLMVYGLLQTFLGTARITVRNSELTLWRGIAGIGSSRLIPASQVAAIVPVISMQQGGNSSSALHAIRLRYKDGRTITLADEIPSRQEARWIVSQIETIAGLRLDTHVEVELPLGVAPAPPGSAASPVFRVRTQGKPASAAVAMAVMIFMATVGFLIFRTASRAPRRSNPHTAAASSKAAARRVFPNPLNEEDEARLDALPAQAQAEELLERAVNHDPRALEFFNERLAGWYGHLQESDRLKQLDQRSMFSTDLRVRYAQADINLLLDGWHKDHPSAELLMERARTDAKYRPAAVYFLGMMAGRGVDYERIHPVLLNYARSDQDAYVRQWAVEGLRFLGKDEVLDELFTIFTEDPSMQVRERAGCNLSDCGIFRREQRMQMVPKLVDLALKPSTTGQMRAWTFMALREITGENLPADAVAWSRWYQEHGEEKLKAFQQQPWWQVRGDE